MLKRRVFKCILIGLLISMQVAFGAVNSNYEVSGSVESDGTIEPNSIFIYKLTVKNVSGAQRDTVKAKFSGDFATVSGSDALVGTLNDDETKTISVPLKYTGSGDHLNIYVYDSTSDYTIVDNISIGNISQPTDNTPTDPVNKDQYYPTFKVYVDNMPKFFAGQKKTFSVDLENTSTFSAKNVKINVVNDSELFPFDDQLNPIQSGLYSFTSKEKKSIDIDVTVKSNAKNGFIDLPIQVVYENVFGLEKVVNKTLQIEVVNKSTPPSIVVASTKVTNDILTPGQEHLVQFDLKNLGSLDIKNLTVSLEGLAMKGIYLNADTKTKMVNQINGNGTNFVLYNLAVSNDFIEDQEELSLVCTYYDSLGTKYEETISAYMDVLQNNQMYNVDVKVNSLPSIVHPEDHFKIKFTLENNNSVDVKDLKLSIKSEAAFINKSDPIIYVDDLKSNSQKSFEFELIADKQMTTNNYPVYIVLTEGEQTREKYVGVYVDGDSQSNSKPKIIVDSYSFDKDVILAGQTFELTMAFFNTSNNMGIQNAKVSLSSDEGAFVPVDASSSFYIEEIGVKEEVSHTILMKAKSDLSVKTYNVTADIEYEDSNGNSYDKNNNPYTAKEHMAIPVMQELRLEIENISVPEMGFAYQPMELFVEFFNMGKSPLMNMMVKTEGDFEIQDGKYFVGNFSPGSNDYYSCSIMPMVIGTNTGKVIFEYEDALGEVHSVVKEFTFEAMEMEQNFEDPIENFGDGDMMPFEEDEKKSFPFVFVGIGLVLVIILIVVLRKRSQKKKELALDE